MFDVQVDTAREQLFAARVAHGGEDLRRLTPDDGAVSEYPDIAVAPGRVALTWWDRPDGNQEVCLASGADLTPELVGRTRRVTETPGESIGAYLACNDTRRGVVGRHGRQR